MIPDPIKKASDKKPAILLATLDAAILREREREKGNAAKEEVALSLDHIPVLLSQGKVELVLSTGDEVCDETPSVSYLSCSCS